MFGLRNYSGSCWVNATLQSIFRIPEVQARYGSDHPDHHLSPLEKSLEEIYVTKGERGLKDFYNQVKNKSMPAGEGIGDSHELLEALCDKVPFLDKLFRFKIANTIKCSECDYSDTKTDTMIEFSITPLEPKMSVSQCIADAVKPFMIHDWKCEKCSQTGCTKQLLLATFPQILAFHLTSLDTSVSYSPLLAINGIRYALFAVVCFNGGHWWTYGRDMPPGKPWFELDDTNVREHDPSHFPLSDNMRLLMYYCLKE